MAAIFGGIAFWIAVIVVVLVAHAEGYARGWDRADRFWRDQLSDIRRVKDDENAEEWQERNEHSI